MTCREKRRSHHVDPRGQMERHGADGETMLQRPSNFLSKSEPKGRATMMATRSSSRRRIVNPPPPSSSKVTESSIGRKFLALVRRLETDDSVDLLKEATNLLQTTIDVVQRRGLLQGDAAMAGKVLAQSNASSVKQPGKNRRGKRVRSNKSNELSSQNDDVGAVAESGAAQLDVQLIMSAVTRLFSNTSSVDRGNQNDREMQVRENLTLLKALAGELCFAICEYIKSHSKKEACVIAEYEIVAASGKAILTGIDGGMRIILSEMEASNGLYCVGSDDEERTNTLQTSLVAASSLVSLFGTKLSRSAPVLSSLREVALEAVLVTDDKVSQSSALLLAALHLSGGTDRVTPASLWNQSLNDTLFSLYSLMKEVVPVDKCMGNGLSIAEPSEPYKLATSKWVSMIQQSGLQETRLKVFLQVVRGLVCLLVALLSRDLTGMSGETMLLDTEVPCSNILGVIEMLLSFPVSSEAMYYGTKKRLRQEPVERGLLSPSSIAFKVACEIKTVGHELLDSLIHSVGPAPLLPHGRSILGMVSASMLTSSSNAVRIVLDPARSVHVDYKRKRWLHTSLVLRSVAAKSFCSALLAFGTDATDRQSHLGDSSQASSSEAVDRGLTLACAYVIEELFAPESTRLDSSEWGSAEERTELVETACDCLTSALLSGGEFLSIPIRSLIDSVAETCLLSIDKTYSVCSTGETRACFLTLATNCLSTPFANGAASPISCLLRDVAHKSRGDRQQEVATAAAVALNVCNSMSSPRVTALHIVTQSDHGEMESKALLSATEVASNLDTARERIRADIERAKTAEADAALHKEQSKKAKTSTSTPKAQKITVPAPAAIDGKEPSAVKTRLPPIQQSAEMKATEATKATAAETSEHIAAAKSLATASHTDDEDDEFPMIVDTAPDEDDE